MKEEYIAPQLQLAMFHPSEPVAEQGSDPVSEHDNGYVDWFFDDVSLSKQQE